MDNQDILFRVDCFCNKQHFSNHFRSCLKQYNNNVYFKSLSYTNVQMHKWTNAQLELKHKPSKNPEKKLLNIVRTQVIDNTSKLEKLLISDLIRNYFR